jgi:outer membrane receptor protein involved in Fe transport
MNFNIPEGGEMKNSRKNTIASAMLLAGFVASAGAEQVMEEVVVTATKRDSTIQDLPFSINAQTQRDIQRSGAQSLQDLSRNVAGLAVQNLGPGQSQVSVRGVSAGQIIRDQPGVKEQVGIYLDESVISLSLFTPDLDLFDLNRVETLRGPQGTLFGSGSVGGTIRYITNQPDAEALAAQVEVNVNALTDGNEGGHFKGMVNIPLSDGKSALRIVGYATEYAGFIDALGENGASDDDVNTGNRKGGRVALKWEATDNLTITPRVIYQEVEADGFNRQEHYNLFANPYSTTRPAFQLGDREQYLLTDERFSDETLIVDATVEWRLENFDVTFVTSWTDREILVSRDASALTGSVTVSPLGGIGFPEAGVALPSNLRDTTDLEQSTYELRLSSNSADSLQWLVGVFYADAERKYAQRLPTPGYDAMTDAALGAGVSAAVSNGFPADSPYNADLPYENTQLALFGELTYDINDRLQLTVGGRYYDFEEERRFTSGGLFSNGDDQFDKTKSDGFTPRVMLSYDLNDSTVVNAQASQGFRQGGDNDPLNVGLCSGDDVQTFGGFPDYDDEKLWNYEAGFKSRFDNGVVLNAAVFYADIEDLQVTQDAGSCSSRVVFNVPDAHTAGVEVELSAQPTERLELSLAASLLEAEFDSTIRKADGTPLGGMKDGNRLPSVPEIQLAGTATYTIPVDFASSEEMYFSATVHHMGDRFTQPGDQVSGAGTFGHFAYAGATGTETSNIDLELDAFTIVNLSAGLVGEDWEAILYVNNVTDENADLSFDRERGGAARLAFRTNMPRNIGLTFRKFL